MAVVLLLGIVASSRQAESSFVRGDTNESGKLEITDAIHTLQYLFQGKGDALRCLDAADADDDGAVGLPDAILGLSYLFRAGREPPLPYPACGQDPTADELGCVTNEACGGSTISFFDISVEAGGVFWVVDRSGTFQDSGELTLAKRGVVTSIETLIDGTWFGVLFVSSSLLKFPQGETPARANDETRASGIALVNSVAGGAGSCDLAGLLEAIEFAQKTPPPGDVVFYVTDGGGTCPGFDSERAYLELLRRTFGAANQGTVRLHTVGVGPLVPEREQHLRDLAEQNGGELHLIPLR